MGPIFAGAEGTKKGGIEEKTGGLACGKDIVGVTSNGTVDTCTVKDVGGVKKRGRRSGWRDMVGVMAGTASVIVCVGSDKKEAEEEEGAAKAEEEALVGGEVRHRFLGSIASCGPGFVALL